MYHNFFAKSYSLEDSCCKVHNIIQTWIAVCKYTLEALVSSSRNFSSYPPKNRNLYNLVIELFFSMMDAIAVFVVAG